MKKGRLSEQDYIWNSLDEAFGTPGNGHPDYDPIALPQKIKNLETVEIEDALISHGWNVAAASRELGLGRTRLIARMKVLGIKDGSKGL